MRDQSFAAGSVCACCAEKLRLTASGVYFSLPDQPLWISAYDHSTQGDVWLLRRAKKEHEVGLIRARLHVAVLAWKAKTTAVPAAASASRSRDTMRREDAALKAPVIMQTLLAHPKEAFNVMQLFERAFGSALPRSNYLCQLTDVLIALGLAVPATLKSSRDDGPRDMKTTRNLQYGYAHLQE